jgi:hypothetical protein
MSFTVLSSRVPVRVHVWVRDQLTSPPYPRIGEGRTTPFCVLVILMHMRAARTTGRSPSIVQVHVERHRRSIRFTQVVGDEVAGHVAADPHSGGRRRPEIVHVAHRERTNLRLAMTMQGARRVEPGIENAFGDGLGA